MMKNYWIFSLIIITTLVFANLPKVSQAEEKVGLFLMPSKIEMKCKPGNSLERNIIIKNKGNHRITVKISYCDFFIKQNGEFVFHPKSKKQYSCASWLKVKPNKFQINPEEIKEIKLSIKTPKIVESGDHWGAVIFDTEMKKSRDKQVIGSLASLVFVTIPGKIKQKLTIDRISFKKHPFSSCGYGKIVLRNNGNVHITTKGTLEIDGNNKASDLIKSFGPLTILPSSSRDIMIKHSPVPAIGIYKYQATVLYGPDIYTFNRSQSKRKKIILYPGLVLLGIITPQIIVFLKIIKARLRYL